MAKQWHESFADGLHLFTSLLKQLENRKRARARGKKTQRSDRYRARALNSYNE